MANINQAKWTFTKEQLLQTYTPERMDQEIKDRRNKCAFLQEAGIQLKLPQLTIATAIVYFNRFFVRHKYAQYDKNIVATTCLFLAGKVEESPKKLKDVITVSQKLLRKKLANQKTIMEYEDFREKILATERQVLKSIAYDLSVEHPYTYLLKFVKAIKEKYQSHDTVNNVNTKISDNLAQVAWNFVNDSLRTTLCLAFSPQLIATASIYLASKYLNISIVGLKEDEPSWYENFQTNPEVLDQISNEILDLYENNPPNQNSHLTNGHGSTSKNNSQSKSRDSISKTSNVLPENNNSQTSDTNHLLQQNGNNGIHQEQKNQENINKNQENNNQNQENPVNQKVDLSIEAINEKPLQEKHVGALKSSSHRSHNSDSIRQAYSDHQKKERNGTSLNSNLNSNGSHEDKINDTKENHIPNVKDINGENIFNNPVENVEVKINS